MSGAVVLVLLFTSFAVGFGASMWISAYMPRSAYVAIFAIITFIATMYLFVGMSSKVDLGVGLKYAMIGLLGLPSWFGCLITCAVGRFAPESSSNEGVKR